MTTQFLNLQKQAELSLYIKIITLCNSYLPTCLLKFYILFKTM